MKNISFVFLALLVCTVFMPSINFVYADIPDRILSGQTIHADVDQVLEIGLVVESGAELIVDRDITLTLNDGLINNGKITIDGTLIIKGILFDIDSDGIFIRCGTLDVSGAIPFWNGPTKIPEKCTDNEEIVNDLFIAEGTLVVVPASKVLITTGDTVIAGTLKILGFLENRGTISFSSSTSTTPEIDNRGTLENRGLIDLE